MPGKLTTHVLDTALGRPAAGMRVDLYTADGSPLAETTTDADGRTAAPLLAGDSMKQGAYRLRFHVGDYFMAMNHPDARRFLDVVPVDFLITAPAEDHHVPLLVSPWSYSTYRGS